MTKAPGAAVDHEHHLALGVDTHLTRGKLVVYLVDNLNWNITFTGVYISKY